MAHSSDVTTTETILVTALLVIQPRTPDCNYETIMVTECVAITLPYSILVMMTGTETILMATIDEGVTAAEAHCGSKAGVVGRYCSINVDFPSTP